MSLPLRGVRILDLSRLLPGPLASLVLADFGAQVDKIEDMAGGDYLRAFPPPIRTSPDGDTSTTAFLTLNRNKRSAVVDLKKPEAKEAFLQLVRHYDVLLEQFRPGVLERLGLSHTRLLEQNPRLIICALTGYGQTGPLSHRAGHDLNYLARGGVLGFHGPAEGPPTVPGFQLADVSGGLYCVIGILGALLDRAREGDAWKGRVVDVAMIETAMPFAILGFGQSFGGHTIARGNELITGGVAPYRSYTTKDGGAMTLASLEPKFWMQFCAGIGRNVNMSDLVPGPHQEALIEELKAKFLEKTREEWIAFSAERDCCLEPVLSPDEARRDPHLAARKMFFELQTPWGPVEQLRTPLTPTDREHTAPPRSGEHTDAILREAGLDDDAIANLRAIGAIR